MAALSGDVAERAKTGIEGSNPSVSATRSAILFS